MYTCPPSLVPFMFLSHVACFPAIPIYFVSVFPDTFFFSSFFWLKYYSFRCQKPGWPLGIIITILNLLFFSFFLIGIFKLSSFSNFNPSMQMKKDSKFFPLNFGLHYSEYLRFTQWKCHITGSLTAFSFFSYFWKTNQYVSGLVIKK